MQLGSLKLKKQRCIFAYLVRNFANIPASLIHDWQNSFVVLLNQVTDDLVIEVINLKYKQ